MDGLDLTLKNLGPCNFRIFGGGDATYYESYDKDDLVWGVEATGWFRFLVDRLLNILMYWTPAVRRGGAFAGSQAAGAPGYAHNCFYVK